jgi:histidine ammonia-lyase
VLAIEALVAAQAVDLAAPASIGRGPAALYRAVRSHAAPLDEDRSSADDVERLAAEVFGVRTVAELLKDAGIGADWP